MIDSRFLHPLRVEDLGKGWWELTDWFGYYSKRAEATIYIPPGFVCDFASVPRLPVAYWLFGGKANGPAAIHDILYRWAFTGRIEADKIFNEAMRVDGKWFTTRWPMTGAVMGLGWASYKECPGVLDYRVCKTCQWGYGIACIDCGNYFDGWSVCYRKGFWPDMPTNHFKRSEL